MLTKLRTQLGVVILHCLYSVFHHARPAGSRTPGSSAGYHIFSGISDLCVLPLYAYGAYMTNVTRNTNDEWKANQGADPDVVQYMVPSVYYGLIGAGGLHVLSLVIALWLAVMFRRISAMPPDMNPLEANLTSRVHKRNKSSVATTSTYSDEKRESQLYDDSSRPPSIPFMHTRQNSESSFTSRDSRVNLPSRQYQVAPANRNSATSQDLKRMSAPPSAHRASYMEIPLGETGASPSRPTSMYTGRPSTGSVPSYRAEPVSPAQTIQPRSAKFTETWYASESLISRTQQRNRSSAAAAASKPASQPRYATLDASSDSDSDADAAENFYTPGPGNNSSSGNPNHPNPLRSNPTSSPSSSSPTKTQLSSSPSARRPRTPFSRLRASILSDISLNDRRVSGDITDQRSQSQQSQPQQQHLKPAAAGWAPRNRDSSIQPDADFSFYSKPYGELKAATPPILVGGGGGGGSRAGARVVSSGNDISGGGDLGAVGRRNVSGRAAEEGRAGVKAGGGEGRWSRYGVLNE